MTFVRNTDAALTLGRSSPRTKEALIDRILSLDFNGDLRTLGQGVRIARASAQSFYLICPDIERTYEIVARLPHLINERVVF